MHEPRDVVACDERAVGEVGQRRFVVALSTAVGEPFGVEPLVDRRHAWNRSGPHLEEAIEVVAPALRAGPVTGGERGRIIEEEQLRVPTGLQQFAAAVLELQSARDPAPNGVTSADFASIVVEASAVAVPSPAPGPR